MSARTEVVRLALQLLRPLVADGTLKEATDRFDKLPGKATFARVSLADDRATRMAGGRRKHIAAGECLIDVFNTGAKGQIAADEFADKVEKAVQAGISEFPKLRPPVAFHRLGTRIIDRHPAADLTVFFAFEAKEPHQ